MDALELIKKLQQSQIVRSELPMQLQLGFPWLEKRNDRLCISFKAHKEEYVNGSIVFYAAQYDLAWAWPFEHLVLFRNRSLYADADFSGPLCTVSGKLMLTTGKYLMDELYQECTWILSAQEKGGSVTDTMIRAYQRQYRETAETLGLTKLYGPRGEEEAV